MEGSENAAVVHVVGLFFFVGGGGGWGVRMSGLYQFYFWLVGTNIQLLMVGD